MSGRNIRPRCWSLKEGVKREMIASKHWRIRRRPWLRKAIWCRYCKTLEWYIMLELCFSSAQWLVPTYMYFCFLVWICSCLKIIFWHPQGHPMTVFSKISVQRNKYCLEFSITRGRLKISWWPFYSCTIFEAHLINSLRFSKFSFFTFHSPA